MMKKAEINYGGGHAELWGDFNKKTVERFFMVRASDCFGIRKSIMSFDMTGFEDCDALPVPWDKMEGAASVLKHSGGDTIVWDGNLEKIKSEWD